MQRLFWRGRYLISNKERSILYSTVCVCVCVTQSDAEYYVMSLFCIFSYHNVGMSMSCRLLVGRARRIAQEYQLQYNECIPVSQLVQKLATVVQEFTQSG